MELYIRTEPITTVIIFIIIIIIMMMFVLCFHL